MGSIRRMLLGGSALALLAAAGALACGPDFPWQLLDDRAATLRHLPVDSFFFQATHLLPPPDPALHDQALLPQAADVQAAPTCTALRDPAEAGAPAGGPVATLLASYATGAASFEHADSTAAAVAFRDALATGAGTAHAVCAAFMLGRSLALAGDPDGARAAFLRTRALASHGVPDTLGLAVASFGEQARLALDESGLAVSDSPAPPERVTPTPERLVALHQAATLYAQQAAYGSQSGVASLQEVAEALFSSQQGAAVWFDAAAADPRLRQLLVSYALADTPAIENENEGENVSNPLSGSLDSKPVTARLLDRLAPVFDPAADPRDAGRLAAVAYLAGRYDLAARFAVAPEDPLSAWVRAKLSLQHDDLAATAQAFDAAVHALAAHPGAIGEQQDRLRAEPAVIAIGQGDFGRALRVLYGFGPAYWGDVAYVAERLLSTDELHRFVAGLKPAAPLPAPDRIEGALRYPWPSWDRGFRPDLAIRELLARRLMRDGRGGEAAAAFMLPAHRAAAVRYTEAINRSESAFWRTDRARGAWDAAVLARENGMELFGTEIMPDEHVIAGEYDSGYGPSQPPTGRFVTSGELQRYAESIPRPDLRYHYRFKAATLAERSASLLPPRSQAYAAVLCAAAQWVGDSNNGAGRARLYRLYLAQGPLLPQGMLFGASCPPPDFAAAAGLRWTLPLRRIVRDASMHWHGLVRRLGV